MGQRRAPRHRAPQGLPAPSVSDTARIRLTLTGDGQLTTLGVGSSSGDAALDRAGGAGGQAAQLYRAAVASAMTTGPFAPLTARL